MKTDLTHTGAPRVTRETADPKLPALGEWYWVKADGQESDRKWLGAVVHVGSNYVQLRGPSPEHAGCSTSLRVHIDTFDAQCTFEPNAEAFIQRNIARHKGAVDRLMGEIKLLTERLAIDPRALPAGETQALALRSGTPIDDYKQALVKAKDNELPKLFERIKHENDMMAQWMTAQLLPLEAQAEALKPVMDKIKARIFNVQLYAGLVEEVTQIQDGPPAALDEPIRLFQRRAYMDEECLVDYRHGGMAFKQLSEFDQWLLEPEHLTRLLPFPRCVLAFQVRRRDKDYSDVPLSRYISMVFSGEMNLDKKTLLYMRNGGQVFRLTTGIEFGSKLFPDLQQAQLDDTIYAKVSRHYGKVDGLITAGDYEAQTAERARQDAAYAVVYAEWQAKREAWFKEHEDQREAWQPKGLPHELVFPPYEGYRSFDPKEWERWTPDSVHYDDISKYVAEQIDHHNRVVLVLQGLLDRSPVFHPHPPYKLWEPESFQRALVLVFDEDRALTSGEAPSFEAYRARLNALLKAGDVTVGQEIVWEEREAEKENERQANDWRIKNPSNYKRWHPYGNPGPGTLARVVRLTGKGALFNWTRPRKRERYWGPKDDIKQTVQVPVDRLLNVSAYVPGDFKQFYNDPRTRADYLQWAPFLLEAEEYHAGNRRLGEDGSVE